MPCVKNHLSAGNDLQTVLLLSSAFLCFFCIFGLASPDTLTVLTLSHLVPFLPIFEVIPEIYRNFALFVKMVVVMSILIGLNWQRINGRRFIKLRELHVVVGCVEGRSTTAKDISKRLCVLSKNQNIRCLMKRKKRCWKVKQFLMVCKCLIEPYTVIGSKILQTMSRSRKVTLWEKLERIQQLDRSFILSVKDWLNYSISTIWKSCLVIGTLFLHVCLTIIVL